MQPKHRLLYNTEYRTIMSAFLHRTVAILSSRRFFQAIVLFFALESAWIALSAVYPQAFDENFHFGIIKIYSHYWLPFLSSQPPDANAYSAVTRDPSYLYHFLMSFPYRLIALFIHGQTVQVIILRFINIGLWLIGLHLFRRVLLGARISQAAVHVSLLLLALIPVAPQLAGQINYDNLLFPLVAWACLLAMKLFDELKAKQPSTRTILALISLCLFTSLVKYEFLPIFVGIVLFLTYIALKRFDGSLRSLWSRIWASWRDESGGWRIVLIALTITGLSMFAQRDGLNLIKYHTLEPDCGKVLSVQACNSYNPWSASHARHQFVLTAEQRGKLHLENPLQYTASWAYWLWYRLFFAVNGPVGNFRNYPPLPLPAATGALIGITGIVSVVVLWRRVFKNSPYLLFFGIVSITYLLTLWADGYMQYRYTDTLVLMNGRYLFPILLLVAAIIVRAFVILLKRRQTLKTWLAVVVVFLFLQGGGVMTFILRSEGSWDWPNSAAVKANNAARAALRPVVIEGSRYYHTHVWVFN